jgi:hypothetical protein
MKLWKIFENFTRKTARRSASFHLPFQRGTVQKTPLFVRFSGERDKTLVAYQNRSSHFPSMAL